MECIQICPYKVGRYTDVVLHTISCSPSWWGKNEPVLVLDGNYNYGVWKKYQGLSRTQ